MENAMGTKPIKRLLIKTCLPLMLSLLMNNLYHFVDSIYVSRLGEAALSAMSLMSKNAIGLAIACEEYGAAFFRNGAHPGGILEHPGIMKDPAKVRKSWNQLYQGGNKAHKTAVLEEGIKYHAIGIPPEQAQYLETRKFQINEIW